MSNLNIPLRHRVPSAAPDPGHRILAPGRNCWRLARAGRVAFLVDAAAYFSVLRAAMARARHSVFIIGWDVDSRTVLEPGIDPEDHLPVPLGDFLDALVKRRHGLTIHVLDWDYTMLFALDREPLPSYRLGWRTHPRLHFRLDDQHPLGACQHQKIVVIDDALAFVGGIDLTQQRWDTPEHRPDDPRRVDPRGRPYPPFHDVELAVDGAAAAALGELARERWFRAGGRRFRVEETAGADPWPPWLAVDLTDIDIGIARTEPAFDRRAGVGEVKQLYLDAIAAAQQSIYIENQYFTAAAVGAALTSRLREPHGPEVVVVSQHCHDGWLETNALELLSAQLIRDLRAADSHGRFAIYTPCQTGIDLPIKLHSKLMVVDGRFLRIGSANLNNRSMGVDSECDLAIEGTAEVSAIAGLQDRLLGEHLGVGAARVQAEIARRGSLIATIEALHGNPRSLEPLRTDSAPPAPLPASLLVDPERPVQADGLVEKFVPDATRGGAHRRITLLAGLLLTLGALTAAWQWTPLAQWLDVQRLVATADWLRASPAAPLWVPLIYLAASLLAAPITVLIVVTLLVFGPLAGFVYALASSLLAAAGGFLVGQLLGRPVLRRLAGPRLNTISRRLGDSGLLAVLAVRLIPVAPFTVVNLVAGASHIRFRDYLLGTLLGLLPGLLALTLFSDRVLSALRDPSPASLALLAAALAIIAAGALAVRRWLRRHDPAKEAA